MKQKLQISFFLLASICISQIQAPEKYIYNYGKKVSYYHEVENYFEHLCKESEQIKKVNYGKEGNTLTFTQILKKGKLF